MTSLYLKISRIYLGFIYIFKDLFIFFLLLAVLGLCCCTWAFSSCGKWGPFSSGSAGFSLWWLLLLQSISIAVTHGLSCSVACGVFLDRGLNLHPLHWQGIYRPPGKAGIYLKVLSFWLMFYSVCDYSFDTLVWFWDQAISTEAGWKWPLDQFFQDGTASDETSVFSTFGLFLWGLSSEDWLKNQSLQASSVRTKLSSKDWLVSFLN